MEEIVKLDCYEFEINENISVCYEDQKWFFRDYESDEEIEFEVKEVNPYKDIFVSLKDIENMKKTMEK